MAAKYWWQCIACGERPTWMAVCESKSIAAFIRDELAPSGWNQDLLRRTCTCKRRYATPKARWMDFKYQRGRSPWGLTKRLVLTQPQLSRLLRSYGKATGRRLVSASP